MLCVALLAAIATSAVARPGTVARARRAYQMGYRQLQRGNYKRALRQYTRSYDLVARPRTLFNIAVCHEKLGHNAEALKHFQQFLKLAERRDYKYVDDAKKRIVGLRKRLQATVRVLSRPLGAKVFVDGSDQQAGITPLVLTLVEGQHRLEARLPGAQQHRVINVHGQQNTTESFRLRQTSTVEIEVEPRDAVIRRIGDHQPHTGTFRAKVPIGMHRFVIARKGYRTETIRVQVKPGVIHERVVRLVPHRNKALVLVRTNNAGARVSLDGLVIGTTSMATAPEGGRARLRHATKAGRHTLIVEDAGSTWQRRLHLSPGERISVDVKFRGNSRIKTWGMAVIGAASMFVGSVVGVSALKDVRSDMPPLHDRGKDRAIVADALIFGGAAALLSSWYFSRRPATSASVERSHEEP